MSNVISLSNCSTELPVWPPFDMKLIDDGKLSCSALKELVFKYAKFEHNRILEDILAAPMYWIGMYVATASLTCTLAMTTDVVQGFRHKKLWFPCKFFTLNAATLTLLAVAMKLPVDLTTKMPQRTDQLAKLSSTVFMCTVMGNFMPSLGTMGAKELLFNIIALDIQVITMVVNISIQLHTTAFETDNLILSPIIVIVVVFMFVLLLLINSSALAVPASKKILRLKYADKHKMASNEESDQTGKFKFIKLKENVKKYWMMVQSGSPQFVVASSATCAAAGAICLSSASFLVFVEIMLNLQEFESRRQSRGEGRGEGEGEVSDYKRSTIWILLIQTFGVAVGIIAPTFRWLASISFKRSKKRRSNYINVFKIEKYWIQKLVEWKESPLGLPIHAGKCRKLVRNIKNIILQTCIGVQKATVVVSKIIRLIPIFFISMILLCCSFLKPLKRNLLPKSTATESKTGNEMDLSRYALQLEGEEELPKRVLKNISNSVDQLIYKAKRKQPKNLMDLLQKYAGFKVVSEFDSNHVPRLHPNCWTLPVATLTSIAIALPNIKNGMVDQLLNSVSEAFLYTRIIEKSLDTKGELVNLGKATDVLWEEIELCRMWLDEDLQKLALSKKNPQENLQRLEEISKKIVVEFERNMNGGAEENPLNWPAKVIAANSMSIISQNVLIDYHGNNGHTNEKLFEKLSVIIADILSDCLTNLPRVITMKCYCSVIEKMEDSVQEASRLLGETEEIMKFLQQRELPSLDPDQAAYINKWRNQGRIWSWADQGSSPVQLKKKSSSFS